ncbi:hypothetical protein EDB85DRAFT_766638 [Lactarius pseudohatsudake]|nr:hypothetical protein EDB85DRAFT_766638 [Lactarius pseudohatsudake]
MTAGISLLGVRVWTWAHSLDTCCRHLSLCFKLLARIAMHIYQLIDENNISLHNDHLPSFLPTHFLPTGLCASSYRQHRRHVEQFRTPLPICVTHGGFLGCTNHSGYYQCRTAHVARIGEPTRSWRFRWLAPSRAVTQYPRPSSRTRVGVSSEQKSKGLRLEGYTAVLTPPTPLHLWQPQ